MLWECLYSADLLCPLITAENVIPDEREQGSERRRSLIALRACMRVGACGVRVRVQDKESQFKHS